MQDHGQPRCPSGSIYHPITSELPANYRRPRAITYSHFRNGRVFTSFNPTHQLDSLLNSSSQPQQSQVDSSSQPQRPQVPPPRPRANSSAPRPCLPSSSCSPFNCPRFTPRQVEKSSLTDLKTCPTEPFKLNKTSSNNINFNLFQLPKFFVPPTNHNDKSILTPLPKSEEIQHLPSNNLTPTWQSSLRSQSTFLKLKERHGPTEIKRQEVIWELIQTESNYVQDLTFIITLFSRPSSPHCCQSNLNQEPLTLSFSIDNTPPQFVKLIENVYQILILHQAILVSLEEKQRLNHGPVILRISENYLKFIHRFKGVYQDYLTRFEKTNKLVGEILKIDSTTSTLNSKKNKNNSSPFGLFFRNQSGSDQLTQLRLNSFLLKPVQRLMKYPLLFKQLCDLTPSLHPDYLPTVQAWKSIDSLIRELEEVKKTREEGEEQVCSPVPQTTRTRKLVPKKLSCTRLAQQPQPPTHHSPSEFSFPPLPPPPLEKVPRFATFHPSSSTPHFPSSHYTRSSELRNFSCPIYRHPSPQSPISQEFGTLRSLFKTKFLAVNSTYQ